MVKRGYEKLGGKRNCKTDWKTVQEHRRIGQVLRRKVRERKRSLVRKIRRKGVRTSAGKITSERK